MRWSVVPPRENAPLPLLQNRFPEFVLPIEIPDGCWFADADADVCDDADDVDVVRRGDADASDDGDGLNCPVFELFDTAAPTAAPSPEACDADVCWADGSIAPLDCGAAEGPLRASAAGPAAGAVQYIRSSSGHGPPVRLRGG